MTEAGKQKAAQNSANYHLAARQIVVPGESPEDYTELHQVFRAFLENTKDFDTLRRYTAPIERACYNAIAELTKLQ